MSSWGNLRFLVQTSAPGVSLDLIDGWLNARYVSALSATDWQGLEAHATIQTQAAYQSVLDTVTATVGSATIVGLLTAWTGAITGQKFYVPGDTVTYIATYVSPTQLTLDRPYEGNDSDLSGTVYAKSPYVLMQNIYTLPGDFRTLDTVLDPITNLPLQPFSKDGLDASVGQRTTVGYPQSYALYDNTAETTPPVLSQIEFYPPPLQARGFPLEYLRNANLFTGQNTSSSPLPFITDALILFGVRADVATHLEKLAQAVKYEAQWDRELARMLLLEHAQRRTRTAFKMEARFVRHRLARGARGMQNAWRGGQPGGPN
jgi:hypothetical protein